MGHSASAKRPLVGGFDSHVCSGGGDPAGPFDRLDSLFFLSAAMRRWGFLDFPSFCFLTFPASTLSVLLQQNTIVKSRRVPASSVLSILYMEPCS